MARLDRLLRFAALLALLAAVLPGAIALGCSGDGENDGDGSSALVGSQPNLQRWVIYFEGPPPDLSAYHKAKAEDPDAVPGIVADLREKAKESRADFAAKVEAVSGRVVDYWWMTNAVTIEIDPTGLPSVKKIEGVARVEPDRLLE